MNWFKRRKQKKLAQEVRRRARHLVDMRGDLMSPAQIADLESRDRALVTAMKLGEYDAIEKAGDALYDAVTELMPKRSFPGVRENVEIIVVAVAVAMGFRTYFYQPFKIPTGSMEPTLYGIKCSENSSGSVTDKMPIKLVKWLITGEWRMEVRAWNSGTFAVDTSPGSIQNSTHRRYYVSGKPKNIPRDIDLSAYHGKTVVKGQMLWAGTKKAGDHVFVDKMAWNFRRPRRGEVSVFSTEGIEGLPPKTHYIKRLIGLPGEAISIDQPNVKVGGTAVTEPETIARVANRVPPYDENPGYAFAGALKSDTNAIALGDGEYLMMGDNTDNSYDGRYWGPVPRKNLLGPATSVYWPYSKRSGRLD